jgi:hypothetical protein
MKKGWYGNSYGHSLAARGVRLYARKPGYVDPLFYAQKMETDIPTQHALDMAKKKLFFGDVKEMHPDADSELLRKKMIKAMDAREGTDTLSVLDSQGVDESVKMATFNNLTRTRMLDTLKDPVKMSYLPSAKVKLLETRIRGIDDARI